MEVQVEAELGGVGDLVRGQLRIHRVNGVEVTVWAMAGGRVRTVVPLDAAVAGEHDRADAEALFRARAGGQFSHVGGDVEGGPVPEPGCGRRVWVETGHREGLCALRGTGPGQLRAGRVIASQRIGKLFAVDDVRGGDVKGRHVCKRRVRVWAGETAGYVGSSHGFIPTRGLVTIATPCGEQLRVSPPGGE